MDTRNEKDKLLQEITEQLQKIQDKIKNGEKDPYLKDKDMVLQAMHTYLTFPNALGYLRETVQINPNYDAGFKILKSSRSTTGDLLDRALKLKGDSLEVPVFFEKPKSNEKVDKQSSAKENKATLHKEVLDQLQKIQDKIKNGDKDPYLKEKDKVLQAVEAYLTYGTFAALEHLSNTVRDNPNYDAGTKLFKDRSATGDLLYRALSLRGDTLTLPNKPNKPR